MTLWAKTESKYKRQR